VLFAKCYNGERDCKFSTHVRGNEWCTILSYENLTQAWSGGCVQDLSYSEQGPPAGPLEHDNRIVNYMTGGNYIYNFAPKRTCTIEYLYWLLIVCCVFRHSLRHHQRELLFVRPVSVLGHAPPRAPSFRLVQTILEPNLFPYKYPNSLIPVIFLWRWKRECSEMTTYKIQTPRNHSEERMHYKYSIVRVLLGGKLKI
jgi:hypothetical protein